jgi:iron complex transport system substrate-binding protein
VKIVSLLPSATEILFAIGAGDEVVGVTHECDYPVEALRLPRLTASAGPDYATPPEIDRHVRESLHQGSSLYSLDRDLLESLRPELIVTQELCPVCAVSYEVVDDAARQLQSDARIVSLEPSSLQEVFDTILLLGRMTGREAKARGVVAALDARVAALRAALDAKTLRPRTLVLEWTDPPMSAGHWIPELIELAGGEPVLANPGVDSKRLEWDAIAASDPDAVIVAPCGFDLAKTRAAVADLDTTPQWRSLRAHRSGRVLPLDGNAYLSRPGPRLVEAAEIIAEWYAVD